MDTAIFDELSDYCDASGVSPATVCLRALNNSRFVERHRRRVDKIAQDEADLREYMRQNPPERQNLVSDQSS